MQVWSRDQTSSHLVRHTLHTPTPPTDLNPIMAQHSSLQGEFYPIRTSLHAFDYQKPKVIFLNLTTIHKHSPKIS